MSNAKGLNTTSFLFFFISFFSSEAFYALFSSLLAVFLCLEVVAIRSTCRNTYTEVWRGSVFLVILRLVVVSHDSDWNIRIQFFRTLIATIFVCDYNSTLCFKRMLLLNRWLCCDYSIFCYSHIRILYSGIRILIVKQTQTVSQN